MSLLARIVPTHHSRLGEWALSVLANSFTRCATRPAPTTSNSMNPSGTVFLVEDDVDVRESAAWTLERHGVAVEAFASAKEILMSLNPDALGCYVLDLRLPEMSGLELRRRLVEKGCRQPFIILSGVGEGALAVEAMRLGAADFIEKPVEPSKLLDAVRKCIELDAVER